MPKWMNVLLAVMVLTACASAQAEDVAPMPGTREPVQPRFERSCVCTQVYDPVTCQGGAVYSNACFARCAGAKGCSSGSSREPRHPDQGPRGIDDSGTGAIRLPVEEQK